jgi:hypothetical protein
LVGGWRVTLDFGPDDDEFGVLLVNQGGTASIVVGDGSASGVWKGIQEVNNFAVTLDFFEDGEDVRGRVRATIHLLDPNNLRGTLTIDQMSPDGRRVMRQEGRGRITGQRMRVVPES